MVSTTSRPVTVARKEVSQNVKTGENGKNRDKDLGINLTQVSYIKYFIIYQKQSMLALLNSRSEINVIYPTFAKELGLPIR